MMYFILLIVLLINQCSNIRAATEYLGKCESTEDCTWLGENSACIYKECRCQEGFRWYQGKCQKYSGLGGDCTEDPGCYDGYNPLALKCDPEKKCVCSDDYYARDNIDCRKTAPGENDLCAIDNDCKVGKCIKGKCAVELTENHYDEIVDYYSNYADDSEDDSCEEGKCDANADCLNGKCICKRGFFRMNGLCTAEIGMKSDCSSDSDCTIKPGKCVEGVCYCRDYYFTADGNRKCVKSMQQTNWNCVSREWCFALGLNSFCSSEGTCKCSSVADFDEGTYTCKKTRDDGDLCTIDSECEYNKKYSQCTDEHCRCKDKYREEDGKCSPDLGQQCDESAKEPECTIENARCLNETCQCDSHFITGETNDKCYKVVGELGGPCELDLQCTASILYTKCTNDTCQCDADRWTYENRCIARREYNSYCNNLLECSISLGDTFVCRKSKCQCGTELKYNKDLNECRSGGATITGTTILFFTVLTFSLSSSRFI